MNGKILFFIIIAVVLVQFSSATTSCSQPSQNPSCPSECLNAGVSCSQQSAGTSTPTTVGTDFNCIKTVNAGCGFAFNFMLSNPNSCPAGYQISNSSSCGFLSFIFGGSNNCVSYVDAGCLSNDSASCPAGYQISNSSSCNIQGSPVDLYQQCCNIPNQQQPFPVHNVTCSSLSAGTFYDYSCVGSSQNCTLSDSNSLTCPTNQECNANSVSSGNDCIPLPYNTTGVIVTPSTINAIAGSCIQFYANETTSINTQVPAQNPFWFSNDTSVNVSQSGTLCLPSNYSGVLFVEAQVTPWSGLSTVYVSNISNYSITPPNVQAMGGGVVYLSTKGISNKQSVNVFSQWSVESPMYFEGSLDGNSAYLTATGSGVLLYVGYTPGNYTVTARAGFLNTSVNITVLQPGYVPYLPGGISPIITVQPLSSSIAAGQTQQFFATVQDYNKTYLTVNSPQWFINNNSIATISDEGVATSIAPGLALVTVSIAGGNASATLNIGNCVLGSVGNSGVDSNGCALQSKCVLVNYTPSWGTSTKADACCASVFNGTATADGCCHLQYASIDPNCNNCASGPLQLGPIFNGNCWGYLDCNVTSNLYTIFNASNSCNPTVVQNPFNGVLCAFNQPKTSITSYIGSGCLTFGVAPQTGCIQNNIQTLLKGQNFTVGNINYSLSDVSGVGVLINIYNLSGFEGEEAVYLNSITVLPNANLSIIYLNPSISSPNATLNFSYLNTSCIPPAPSLSVQLESPQNGDSTSTSQPDFIFNVTGFDSTYSCKLYVDGSADGGNSSVLNNTSTTILSANYLPNGAHSYNVSCSGNSISITGSSQTYSFTQSAPQILINLLNPGNYVKVFTSGGLTSYPVLFNFTAQGPDNLYNCFLNLDGSIYALTALNDTPTLIYETVDSGTHTYNFSCSNGGLIGMSSTNTFYLENPSLVVNLLSPINQQTPQLVYYNLYIPFNFTASGSDSEYSCGVDLESCYYSGTGQICSYKEVNNTIVQNTLQSTILVNPSSAGIPYSSTKKTYNYTVNCTGNSITGLSNGSSVGQFDFVS